MEMLSAIPSLKLLLLFVGIFLVLLVGFRLMRASRNVLISAKDSAGPRGQNVSLIIKSLDLRKRELTIEVRVYAPVGTGERLLPLNFITDFLQSEIVRLREVPRNELRSPERPSGGWTAYSGQVTIQVEPDLSTFPFDGFDIGVAVEESREWHKLETDFAPISTLFVKSFLPDHSLSVAAPSTEKRSSKTYFFFTLARSRFLRFLTLFLFVVALASSFFLIMRPFKEESALFFLTYFAGLWAARDIVLGPVMEVKPFPSYVDLAVIALFVFTLIALALRAWPLVLGEPSPLGWPS